MTHPPGGPSTPPPPGGPRPVSPLDPKTDAGRAAADSLSQALAEIQVAIWQRRADTAPTGVRAA
jgi:hypothetical protein